LPPASALSICETCLRFYRELSEETKETAALKDSKKTIAQISKGMTKKVSQTMEVVFGNYGCFCLTLSL
jgi:hypothetical protein